MHEALEADVEAFGMPFLSATTAKRHRTTGRRVNARCGRGREIDGLGEEGNHGKGRWDRIDYGSISIESSSPQKIL